ncbi:hypothetical protein ACI8AC_23025 [Geodermatophilus sp. SYSU D00758]
MSVGDPHPEQFPDPRAGPATGPRPSSEERLEIVEQLRRLVVYTQTARVLERRARSAANPALATVLRERAALRRRRADRVRAELVAQDLPLVPPRRRGPAPS